MRRLPIALTAGVLTAGVLVATLAVPVSAASTRWVDDDGHAGPAGCGGSHSVPRKIQPAIDAAGHGDTILVCPGSYTGALTVSGPGKDGLIIKGTTPFAAKVRPPKSGGPILSLLQIVDADRVHIQWLTLAARGDAPCVSVVFMVYIGATSTGTVIQANRIGVSGSSTSFGSPCGYQNGIVQSGGTGKAIIRHNTVADADGGGFSITVNGDRPTVWRNGVYNRKTDQTVQSNATGAGIAVGGDATHAVVRGNHVIGLSTAVQSGPGTPMLSSGISVTGTSGTLVKDNLVRYVATGIVVASSVTSPVIRGNVVRNSLYEGIRLAFVAGALVTGNSSLGSGDYDCRDTNPNGPNTWTGNTGVTSDPAGLCTAP